MNASTKGRGACASIRSETFFARTTHEPRLNEFANVRLHHSPPPVIGRGHSRDHNARIPDLWVPEIQNPLGGL